VKKLIERLRLLLGRPLAYLTGEWARMAPRERRVAAGLGAAAVVLAVMVAGFLYFDSIEELAEQNDDMREALAAMAKKRDLYLENKAKVRAQELKIGSSPPQFGQDLEAAAKEVNIQIPETSERPETPVGKNYVEHAVDVKLRNVDLQSLSKFLMKLETGSRFMIVTRLDVRTRFGETEKFDADVTITSYERVKDADRLKKKPGQAKG
jgi:type II secretory pathway component PulM